MAWTSTACFAVRSGSSAIRSVSWPQAAVSTRVPRTAGNIQQLFSAIGLCAIFMVVLLAALTMSMSARERVTEIAVLKAIGFSKVLLLTLMLTEFVTLTLAGGIGGIALAEVAQLAPWAKWTMGFIQGLIVPGYAVGLALALAVVIGLISGGLPALRAANMTVVDGLRRVV